MNTRKLPNKTKGKTFTTNVKDNLYSPCFNENSADTKRSRKNSSRICKPASGVNNMMRLEILMSCELTFHQDGRKTN
jgi:hypothetical protein